MQAKVSLPLQVVLSLTTPPSEVETVEDYRQYIHDLLAGGGTGCPARPGRPLKVQHVHYNDAELKAIRTLIMNEAQTYQAEYTANGRLPKGFADEQPDDETEFLLDNDVTVVFADRVQVTDGKAHASFPPSTFVN